MAMLVELLPYLISTYKGLKMHEAAVEESWDKKTIKSYRYGFTKSCYLCDIEICQIITYL